MTLLNSKLKIRILNTPLIISIITTIIVVSIFYIHSSIVNIILGLPFILFFPGYALVKALFISRERLTGIELLAISTGTSIAIVALIGFGLNYTPWGIRLEPVLISVASFIYIMSGVALIREALLLKRINLTTELQISLPAWETSAFKKPSSVILIILILCAIGVMAFFIKAERTSETYTEFYILGLNGQAQDYPSDLIVQSGEIAKIRYGTGVYWPADEWCEVTIGIVNHERQEVTYSLKITVDSEPVNIHYNEAVVDELKSIELQHDEKWEKSIGFAPRHLGANQKVELLLFKEVGITPFNSLQLWVNVSESYTDFYALGLNGQAQDYPSDFTLQNGQVTNVRYGTDAFDVASALGEIILGIENHENQKSAYSIRITIDNVPLDIYYDGVFMDELKTKELQPGMVWEGLIGFAPRHLGANRKVEFWLFKGDDIKADNSFKLWVNATEAQ
ncbi:DUF1616 domain-containing protein [Chloroflexota bacterium]